MLQRSDPRKLREGQGIRARTICRALTLPAGHLYRWEMRISSPESFAGYRWARVIRGLEAHAAVIIPAEEELSSLRFLSRKLGLCFVVLLRP